MLDDLRDGDRVRLRLSMITFSTMQGPTTIRHGELGTIVGRITHYGQIPGRYYVQWDSAPHGDCHVLVAALERDLPADLTAPAVASWLMTR